MSKKEDAEFTLRYIAAQVSAGKDPADEVAKEISEIDQYLIEAEIKRLRRRSLSLVQDNLGGPKQKKRVANGSNPDNVEDLDNTNLRQTIMDVVSAANGPINNRDLINSVMKASEKSELYNQEPWILRTVKFLGENEVLSRDADNRIIKGPNF
jgi:hypothetical protein